MIYIPLCFLLIKSGLRLLKTPDYHLHSTMFSINLGEIPHIAVSDPDLHSTMFSINLVPMFVVMFAAGYLHSTMFSINRDNAIWSPRASAIYIPLCFLLIWLSCAPAPGCKIFTFHYVFY